jgi:hypothetical protein
MFMKKKWEAEWRGKTVYIEMVTPPYFAARLKRSFLGVFGLAKAQGLMLYGNEVIDRREVKEKIFLNACFPQIDLVGKAMLSDGIDAHFQARITPKLSGGKCK